MEKERPVLITIQKFIYLLNDFYYKQFAESLAEANASLPLKLANAIRDKLPAFDTHEELCKKIYGSLGKGPRQNFNQLAAYTFRLSATLARNYPAYLAHNTFKIQRLVNEGKGTEADFLVQTLLDISARTEDFQTQIFALNFLMQEAIIKKDGGTCLKLGTRINEILNAEKECNDIQYFAHTQMAAVKLSKAELENTRNYLLSFAGNNFASVRIIALHAYLRILYYFDLKAFEKPETRKQIIELEKDLNNHGHVVFPYLLDLKGSVFFMKLNSTHGQPGSKENEREFEELANHYKAVKYFKAYGSSGQLNLLAIRCTGFYNRYENLLYKPGYEAALAPNDKKQIQECIETCKNLLQANHNAANYSYGPLGYGLLYGALLVISGGKNIKTGIEKLEGLLRQYPQAELNTETDSIFMCIIMGQLALNDYAGCIKSFRRYSKSIKGKPVFEDNDIKIHGCYYAAQWCATKSRQYAVKLAGLKTSKTAENVAEFLFSLQAYFKIPVLKTALAGYSA